MHDDVDIHKISKSLAKRVGVLEAARAQKVANLYNCLSSVSARNVDDVMITTVSSACDSELRRSIDEYFAHDGVGDVEEKAVDIEVSAEVKKKWLYLRGDIICFLQVCVIVV